MNNSEQSFNRLLQEHKSTIYTVCYMFSDNHDEVEDLFQEICIRLWKGFGSFREESSVRTWVWRVATNTCITWQKQQQKHAALDINVDLFVDLIHAAIEANLSTVRTDIMRIVARDQVTDRQMLYISHLFVGMMTSMLTAWIKGGRRESPAQLKAQMRSFAEMYYGITHL